MEKRTPDMYQTIIRRIGEVVENTPVNTGVFVASYDALNSLIYEGLDKALKKPLFRERRGVTSKANEKMDLNSKTPLNKVEAPYSSAFLADAHLKE